MTNTYTKPTISFLSKQEMLHFDLIKSHYLNGERKKCSFLDDGQGEATVHFSMPLALYRDLFVWTNVCLQKIFYMKFS